jgi:hypothetical protein
MNAEYLKVQAGIGDTTLASAADSAVEVRAYAAGIAHVQIVFHDGGTDLDDFDCQFVPQNTRVGEKRLATRESVYVRPADTDPLDAHLRFVCAG